MQLYMAKKTTEGREITITDAQTRKKKFAEVENSNAKMTTSSGDEDADPEQPKCLAIRGWHVN